MKRKVAKKAVAHKKAYHVHHSFNEKDFILLLIGVVVLIFLAGGFAGVFPSVFSYPRVLSAMVGL